MDVFNVYSEEEMRKLAPVFAATDAARIAFREVAITEYNEALAALQKNCQKNSRKGIGHPDADVNQRFLQAQANYKTAKNNYKQAMVLQGKAMRSIRDQ